MSQPRRSEDPPSTEPRLPGVLRTVPAGAEVFAQGEAFTGLYQVLRGTILIYRTDGSGEETVVEVARAGDVMGAFAALDFGPYGTSARALTRAMLLFVPAEEMRQSLPGESRSTTDLALARFTRRLLERVVLLSRSNVVDRLAAFLAARAEPDQNGGGWVRLPETRAEVAAELATTRESISRAFARLRRDGVLEIHGSRLFVPDLKALRSPRTPG